MPLKMITCDELPKVLVGLFFGGVFLKSTGHEPHSVKIIWSWFQFVSEGFNS